MVVSLLASESSDSVIIDMVVLMSESSSVVDSTVAEVVQTSISEPDSAESHACTCVGGRGLLLGIEEYPEELQRLLLFFKFNPPWEKLELIGIHW